MELNKKNTLRILLILCGGILFYLGIKNIREVFGVIQSAFEVSFPLILGACIAFLVNIPMKGFEKLIDRLNRGRARWLEKKKTLIAFFLTLVSVAAVMAFLIGVLVPQVGKTFRDIPEAFVGFWNRLMEWANQTPWVKEQIIDRLSIDSIDWKQVWDSMQSFVVSGAGTVLSFSLSFASSLMSGIVDGVLAVCFAMYILFQKEQLLLQGRKVLYAFTPKRFADWFVKICKMSNRTFANFFAVQCLEACILGFMFFVSMTILRFPYALTISLLIAVTALIPVCGAFIGCAVGIFLIVMVNPMQAVWFVVLFLVLQQIEGNLIYPRVVGNTVGLPAIWVLFAITVGGAVMGVLGMLIFVPLFSILYVLFKEAVEKRLSKRKLRVTLEEVSGEAEATGYRGRHKSRGHGAQQAGSKQPVPNHPRPKQPKVQQARPKQTVPQQKK